MALYEIAILGAPSAVQIKDLTIEVNSIIAPFGLAPDKDISWKIKPAVFKPGKRTSAVGIFFGAPGIAPVALDIALKQGVPILPVASHAGQVTAEIPEQLRKFNCMFYEPDGAPPIALALLECAGLLPRQRRVFVSYRRDESRAVAVQLFDAFSARQFDVFLDTHGVPPAADFQAVLWHRLCDSDVLVVLDTEKYFESRWADGEFGRALAKGIAVLRVGWPKCVPSPRSATASMLQLQSGDLDPATDKLSDGVIDRICHQLEAVRSQGLAVRHLNLVSELREAVVCTGGTFEGVGSHKSVHLTLRDGTRLVAYPTTGVPTSLTMHEAADRSGGQSVAVVYDHLGLQERWLQHLDWLGGYVPKVRWVKVREAAWSFGAWGLPR